MGNIFKNNEAVVHFGNDEQLTVFPKNSVWYKIGFDTNMVEFRSRYNDEVLFYENDITETTINEEIPENFITEFNQIAYGVGKQEITDYDLLCTYNVTSTTQPTSLSHIKYLTSNIAAMYIDNEQVEIGNAATFDSTGEHVVKYKLKDNTKIIEYSFYEIESLISITISDSVTSIEKSSFKSCKSLTSITIPNSVTSIGEYAFISCSSLTSVTLGNGVTSIDNQAFYLCSNLSSITFNGLTAPAIGDNVFRTISSTGSLSYPCGSDYSTITSLSAFANWGKVCIGGEIEYDVMAVFNVEDISQPTRICGRISQNVTYIDDVQVPNSEEFQFSTTGEHTVKYVINNHIIGYKLLQDCTSLTSVTISDSVTSIGGSAFYNCKSLTSINIPDSVTSIGENAFYKCKSLTSITIPNSVTSIGNKAFESCSGVTSISIGDSVTSIGALAFFNCNSLSSITFNGLTVPALGNTVFNGISSTGSLSYPCESDYSNVTSLTVFSNWEKVCIGSEEPSEPEEPSAPEIDYDVLAVYTVTSTTEPTSVFSNTSNINKVYIDDEEVEVSSAYTFDSTDEHTVKYKLKNSIFGQELYGKNVKIVHINNSITSIVQEALRFCNELTEIVIPSSVNSIGLFAFGNLPKLSSLTINSYTSFSDRIVIGDFAKNGTYTYPCGVDVTSLKSSSTLKSWSFECFEPDGIYTYDIATFVQTNSDERNEKLFDKTYNYFQDSIETMYIDGVEITPRNEYVFAKAGTHVIKYLIKQNEGDYPYTISSYAFKNVIGLTSVIINDRITAIDNYAFFDCSSLKEITILDSIKYVGTNAFSHTSLPEFTFNSETIYGSAVLSGCSKLTNVVYNTTQVGANDCAYCYALSSVTLNNVTVIGNNAFKSCTGLTSIVLPETINEINSNAFYSCTNLTDIKCFSKSISCIATAFSTIAPNGTFTYYCDAVIDDVIASLPESYTKVCVKEFFADYDVIATFNVTDISQPVKLYDGTANLTSVAIGDNEIGKVSTYNFSKTGEYTVKYKLTSTKQPSFKGCAMMTSVELLEGCTTLKYGALQDCNNLSALTLPSTLTEIAGFAFNSKNNMRIIRCYATTAPTVQNYSFYQVTKNGMLYYPCGSDYSSWLASGSYYLGYLNWSSDCFVPEGSSFYDISTIINVTSTTEPTQLSADEITTQWFTSTPFRYFVDKMYVDGVEVEPATYHTFESEGAHVVGYTLLNKSEVPMAAFSGTTNLTHVELSDRITFIAPNAFEATSNLSFINIPDSVTEISNGAFYASGIRYAFIGSGVTTMAWNALQNCPNLEVIFFKSDQAPSYQADTFIDNPSLSTIGYLCTNSPNSFTELATSIGVENVECISEEELQNFIDSL